MRVIGITGGSGSGKSTVVAVWRELGAEVVDADVVYHELLKTSEPMLAELRARFPEAAEGGVIRRPLLREIVFDDPAALADLNRITHKYVVDEARLEVELARQSGVPVLVLEAIYLVETEFARICDLTVAVTAPMERRLQRIKTRDRLDDEAAWARMRSQKSDEFYFQACDRVIENDGSEPELRAKAAELYRSIIRQG